jgi:hypothetical protein
VRGFGILGTIIGMVFGCSLLVYGTLAVVVAIIATVLLVTGQVP